MRPRIILLASVLLTTALVLPAKAQTVLDMSLITCQQYFDAPPDQPRLIAWWMRGYYSAAKNFSTIDLRYVDYNTKVVTAYCKKK